MRRYVIVGSGAAGISAAEVIRSQDDSGEITLISEEMDGYYSRPGLAYYLTGEIPEEFLFPFTERDFKSLRLRRVHARVTHLHPKTHRIDLENGVLRSMEYDRLLIATGASAARPDQPGMELKGVVKLDNLDDSRSILKLCHKAREAVVVGGGITALELVEGLRARRLKVHYLLRGDRYWGNVLDETESQIIEQRLKDEGVTIHYRSELGEIMGKRGRLEGIRTKDGRKVAGQILAIAIGIQPRKALAEAAGIETERGILVDPCLQTSQEDIFAAGDVAQVYDPISGKSVLDSLWGPARDQGRAAGLNMAGKCVVYRKEMAFNVTRLAGLTTTIIGQVGQGRDLDLHGIARGDSETWRQLPDAIAAQANFEVHRLRLLVGRNTLLGAVVMGDQTLSQPLQQLIARQVDISSIRASLLAPGAALADLIVDFWTCWKQGHAPRLS